MENNIFNYNGTDITFLSGNGDVMINATQMAKPFGKQVYEYLRLSSTNELIKAITEKYRICDYQVVTTRPGSPENGGGTWMNKILALDYAQWLSVDLKLWCTEKLDELMRYGMTATQPTLEAMVDNPDLLIQLATKLKEERAEKEQLQLTVETQTKELVEAAPKVKYYDKTLNSSGLLTINMIALHLGISAVKLNKLLVDWKVQYRQSGLYFLCSQYRDKGYADTRPHPYTSSSGEILTKQHLYWTEKGKEFIIKLYNDKFLSNKESA